MPKFGAPAAGRPERELDKGNEVDFFFQIKNLRALLGAVAGGLQPRALIRTSGKLCLSLCPRPRRFPSPGADCLGGPTGPRC